jgi:glycosyltransferase involved in cell wall biosynthesis
MLPRISVVTPSYNQAHFLEATIRSVLDQQYPNLEFIIVDGGSTDNSVEVIRRYETHLAYWISEKDRGASDAIAKGFAKATGDIMAYLNSDDVYLPGTLDAVAAAFSNDRADVVYGNCYWIDAEGRTIGERRQTPFLRSGYLYGACDLQQPATFWTRVAFDKAGGMDPAFQFAFDTDLFFRFALQGARFKHVNRFFAGFRIHGESKSSTQRTRCEAELTLLRKRDLRYPFRSPQATVIRNLARLGRTAWYVLQGDGLWLIRRIPDRWRSRKTETIVGPRAKWI